MSRARQILCFLSETATNITLVSELAQNKHCIPFFREFAKYFWPTVGTTEMATQIALYTLTPLKGALDGATWAPWAETLTPFSAEVSDPSKSPPETRKTIPYSSLADPLQTTQSHS
jgi:hypothetical protein